MSNTIEECELKRMVDAKHRKMMTVKYELQVRFIIFYWF